MTTYRIQFHKNFTFRHFKEILPYLQQLGITTIYASPIFKAVPGSTHGYDVIDPNAINPEIGTGEELMEISRMLKEMGIQWLQDIVPNHMAFDHRNEWLMDVLEKGKQSEYASVFDITWDSPVCDGKIMVPFLGSNLSDVIHNGELKVEYVEPRFVLKYYESIYPLHHSFASIKNSDIRSALDAINNDKKKLRKIINEQVYRLCHWQLTDKEINYRRFFTVNGLICLNIQQDEVFELHHKLIKQLVDQDVFQGLRIDHIDGLYDPAKYLKDLRKLAGEDRYIVVEKILQPNEGLPGDWPLQGNTGYDFLAIVNNLFTKKDSEKKFTHFYRELTKDHVTLDQHIRNKKAYILFNNMAGELENLYRLFLELNLVEKKFLAAIHPDDLRNVIGEFLIQCPVYRYYGNHFPLSTDEAAAIQAILNKLKENEPAEAVQILENVLLKIPVEGNEEYNARVAHFYKRCMQFSGPLMAKGVEDTLMYTCNSFIAHNEVGDAPSAFGLSADEFHQKMIARQQQWPLSQNATSTHDTKRGEDVRARLNVLSDIPENWFQLVNEWIALNKDLKQNGHPDVNDEYMIYQSLIGSYPMPGNEEDNFSERFQSYLEKALREAKTHSNWTTPNNEYEAATKNFAAALLDKSKPFWNSFQSFHQQIADHGIVNSLSQVILKFMCPGVPDVYQGCELWDLSFVDPDNRRDVDYEKRKKIFENAKGGLKNAEGNVQSLIDLWDKRYDGSIKLWLTHLLLNLRKTDEQLFTEAEYIPLQVDGIYKDHAIAFARKNRENVFIVVLPLHTATLCKMQQRSVLELDWQDTNIILPKDVDGEIEQVFLGIKIKSQKSLALNDIFKPLPFAVMSTRVRNTNERGAGILLHITSLPSAFGIGDLGPEAKAFADFLKRSKQKYWQMLPLNPTEAGQGHSPYSATSGKAGYWLMISPELLAKAGLLDQHELQSYHLPKEQRTNYPEAEKRKAELLNKAFENFEKKSDHDKQTFLNFCEQEQWWLDDFAFCTLLKKIHEGKPWYEWPDEYKLQNSSSLENLAVSNEKELEKIKWFQFIFYEQWNALKAHCNNNGIKLIGDMPFYISYDSADVWSHKEIFALDEQGNNVGQAGVPPDAFSADGQLWGMPVFRWNVLKEQDYQWWIGRIKKSRELFDIIRIDHFRAFADYWEVPAGEITARNGEWKAGPGADFFNTVQKELGELPFVAEDLGDVDEKVFNLRDEFYLPGMKVLQFAFGDDMPASLHIPHNFSKNFLVYTGTHDNNTSRGWFRTDADEKVKHRLEQYLGRSVSEEEVSNVMIRLAYSSVADIAIIPMQDVLSLDENGRMNTPASAENNWGWRLIPGQVNHDVSNYLRGLVEMYNRD